MKKCCLALLLVFTAAGQIFAQDTLTRIDGSILLAKVDSVGKYDVNYTYFVDEEVRKRHVSKSVFAGIAYADGTRLTFFNLKGKEVLKSSPLLQAPNEELYQMGRKDARRYYSRYSGAYTGTLLATFPGSPIAGAIVGAICSASPPKEKNLGIPNAALAENIAYHDGYFKKARAIKAGKIWTGFGLGVLANVALFALLSR